MNNPDDIALISSTCDMATSLPANTGLAENFKVAYSLAYSFKKSIKRDSSIFTIFKGGKYWDTCHRNSLAISREQYADEVLNTYHHPVTDDDVNLFK